MGELTWGVWVEGPFVTVVADGLSAFGLEAEWRRRGAWDAVAVWSWDGVAWWPVPAGSVLRPDPAPPPQGGWRYRRWSRGKFRRRKDVEA